ncbi:MAG: hypothetical protein ACSLFE_02045 [Gemmatimonadaceae bacterium]
MDAAYAPSLAHSELPIPAELEKRRVSVQRMPGVTSTVSDARPDIASEAEHVIATD